MAEPLFVDSKGRAIEVPAFRGPIADTHAHLDMLEDPALAIARAARAGVGFIATVADVTEDAHRTYEQLEVWLAAADAVLSAEGLADVELPLVRIVLGAHPHNAKDWGPAAAEEFRRLVADERTCAVGELGLDYHYDHSPRDVQRDAMSAHLELAHEYALPAVIHLREAHDDGLAILRDAGVPKAGAILHCYTLDADVMQPFLELGCAVSFAGPATFKKAEQIREAARAVPAGRLLTETDCPFMAPEPFRGRTNEPALVAFTAAHIADARDESGDTFAEHTYDAAIRLLGGERP
jgi:TatD DNase family protein